MVFLINIALIYGSKIYNRANMNHVFESGEEQLETKKRPLLSDSTVKLIALVGQIIALVGGVLTFITQHPAKGYWVFIALAIVVIISILGSWAGSLTKWIYHSIRDKQYVRTEYPKLKRLYERLVSFTERNNGRSLHYILYSASSSQNEVIYGILNSDYIPNWMECFEAQIEIRPKSVLELLQKCHEFTVIVGEFNRNYVAKLQKGLEKTSLPQTDYVDKLEEFRDEFHHYLREVEEWANSVRLAAEKLIPNLYQHAKTIPISHFDRVKTFRTTQKAGQTN